MSTKKPWQDVVREKREIQARLVGPYLKPVVNGDHDVAVGVDDKILDIDSIPDLTELLARGEISAVDLTRGYIQR